MLKKKQKLLDISFLVCYSMSLMKTRIHGKIRDVFCHDKDCPKRSCWHPHDCPVSGYGGVRESKARWMCLTNALNGCPQPIPNPENPEKSIETT